MLKCEVLLADDAFILKHKINDFAEKHNVVGFDIIYSTDEYKQLWYAFLKIERDE